MSWDNSRTILEALQDQGLPNTIGPEISNFLNSATEQQFTEWLSQMHSQQAGSSSASQMGAFDGETWTPSQAPGQFSIKAGVCLHHIYYSEQLPWSGRELDFDRRYCDACLEGQALVHGIAGIDINKDPEFERQRLEESITNIDLNGDLSFLNVGNLDIGSPAEIPFMQYTGQVPSATEAIGEDPSQSFAETGSVMGFEGLDSFAYEILEECPSLLGPAPQKISGQESNLEDEEFDISLAEYCESLPQNQPSFFKAEMTERDYTEDIKQETSEYEDEGMDDAYDEPPSPEIGVSFSPRHIWPGEEVASEEPGYSADYMFLDD